MSNTNENEIGNQPVTISPFSELPICINETEQDRYRREVCIYLLFSENSQKIGKLVTEPTILSPTLILSKPYILIIPKSLIIYPKRLYLKKTSLIGPDFLILADVAVCEFTIKIISCKLTNIIKGNCELCTRKLLNGFKKLKNTCTNTGPKKISVMKTCCSTYRK